MGANNQFPPSSPLMSYVNDGEDQDLNPFSLKGSSGFQQSKFKLNDDLLDRGRGYPTPNPSSSLGRSSSPHREHSSDVEEEEAEKENQVSKLTAIHKPEAKKVTFDIQSSPVKFKNVVDFNVISPEDNIKRIKLNNDGIPVLLGRSSQTCQIPLNSSNKQISRTHVSLTYFEDQITVECLGWNGLNLTIPQKASIKFLGKKGDYVLIPNEQDQNYSFKELIEKGMSNISRTTKLENNFTNFFILKNERLTLPKLNNLILDVRGEICLIDLVDSGEGDSTDEESPTLISEKPVNAYLGKINPHDSNKSARINDTNDLIPKFFIDRDDSIEAESESEADSESELESESDSEPQLGTTFFKAQVASENVVTENLEIKKSVNDDNEGQTERTNKTETHIPSSELENAISMNSSSIITRNESENTANSNLAEIVENNEVKETVTLESKKIFTIKEEEAKSILELELEAEKENIAPKKKIQSQLQLNFNKSDAQKPRISHQAIKDMICNNLADSSSFQIHTDESVKPTNQKIESAESRPQELKKKRKMRSTSPEIERKSKKILSSQSPSSPIDETAIQEIPNLQDVNKIVINHLAFSRLSSTPLSILRNISNQTQSLTKNQLRSILHLIDCIGVIHRTGKDAAGKPLDEEYYYILENDKDQERTTLVNNLRGGTGLRSCRRSHKQYFWKKPAKK